MAPQTVFKRYEIKYLLNAAQKRAVLSAIAPHMKLDAYGKTTIRNVYFDTDDYRLIRYSIEKPVYKEKLRLRAYSQAEPDSSIFVELKKKYKSVVYKRRLILPERTAMDAFANGLPFPVQSQISNEIWYFREYYGQLKPKVFLSYDREAYYSLDGSDFRITFDDRILYRTENLSLCAPVGGTPILKDDRILMEIKTSGAIPLWLTQILTENSIYKTSFSKYGTAYTHMLTNSPKGVLSYD